MLTLRRTAVEPSHSARQTESARRSEAFFSLLLGSLAAPSIYVLVGVIAPEGFHNLRSAEAATLLVAFGSAWVFSALLTFVVGGVLWAPLHVFAYDSLASYLSIAVVTEVSLSLVAGTAPEILGISLAAANSFAVRLAELTLRGHPSSGRS